VDTPRDVDCQLNFSKTATQPTQHAKQSTVLDPYFPDASFHISGTSPFQASLLTLFTPKLLSLGTFETQSARKKSSPTVLDPYFPDASFHISRTSPFQASLLTLFTPKLLSLGTFETKSAREKSSHDWAVERANRVNN
jgi:hypothetical protein